MVTHPARARARQGRPAPSLLLAITYLACISLGLPDSLVGSGLVTALSVATTAVALLGFSSARSYWALRLWAVPYGLGAGAVDAALNNVAAVRYKARHMNWLHAMCGVGASISPFIMGRALITDASRPAGWTSPHPLPWYLGTLVVLGLVMSERLNRLMDRDERG
ncbi:hypothetical protein AXF14_02595 [Actinomyces radicidentis]|uniref:MFS transporter n=1 Tax=Actinomyces radicidentis TaxID=111015 RepID=A0A109W273_ACTRD|nr:hypothetical protein [Actinomyces radicidentis]AMD86689.1 hypothetical protein AXF14_02595 [Actinomyces radicidentis]